MRYFLILFFATISISPQTLANDKSQSAASRVEVKVDANKGDHGSIMLPHDIGDCTPEREGAIYYNSVKRVPEVCTKKGWCAWGQRCE